MVAGLSDEQYYFSKVFFDDMEWDIDTRIPKLSEVITDNIEFKYLDEIETDLFLKRYINEDPDLSRISLIKKIKTLI